jgi:DNA topoisomerase-1
MGPRKVYKKTDFTFEKGVSIYLVIVESPSKCGKIESYLGQNYKCIASKGHIRELNGLKNIDVKNGFEPTFTYIKEKLGHVQEMRKIVAQYPKKNIILATDDDREGEGIAWHLCEIFDLPVETTQRIVFHEITKKALQDAIKEPSVVNMSLVKAQHARQILDILVGFKISPHLWKHIYSSKDKTLSAGRCQTPALRLIYDNDQEKKTQSTEKKYKTIGVFTEKNLEFVLGHEFEKEDEVEKFLKESQTFHHLLTIEKDKESRKSPPKPFNTSRLLQTASSILQTNPKQTMQICQTLYQNGLITYMRTDSMKYAPPFLDTAKQYITEQYGEQFLGQLTSITNFDKNNPHEAIRVTDIKLSSIPTGKNPREASMYKLIWKNTIESCMCEAKYLNTPINLTAPDIQSNTKSKKIYYQHIIETPVFLGWKRVSQKTMDQNESIGLKMYLSTFLDRPVNYSKIESNVVVRSKHSYYNEASLIKKLEDIGIGRPSTFAMIVETIQERGYVKCEDVLGQTHICTDYILPWKSSVQKIKLEKTFGNEKSKLQIQPIGILTIEFLTKHFESMFSYDYTKQMEEDLDNIANKQKKEWNELCQECLDEITSLSKQIAKVEKEKYLLDEQHELLFTQYGPSIRKTNADGTFEYFKVQENLEIEKLRNHGYDLETILAKEPESLGIYENFPLIIKKGRFGYYLAWNDQTYSLKSWTSNIDKFSYDNAVEIIQKTKKDPSVIRSLNEEMSIRKGKFGPYVFYKTTIMKKPKFFPLKKCPIQYETCDENEITEWIQATYLEGK